MFPFSRESKDSQSAPVETTTAEVAPPHPLDALTGGVFSAATSGERAQRVRAWLATDPDLESVQAVYKELSAKDRGAARALRDRLEEARRARAQEAIADEWRAKAQALLDAERLHIADALAWQRDAAKAGAPLARPPLADLRDQLAARVKVVEDLQQRVMVQREAGALLAQRIEMLSTASWTEARDQRAGLEADVDHWRGQAAEIVADADWANVEARFPSQLEDALKQLNLVWEAFAAALAQAEAAAGDRNAALPPVPVWADELQAARAEAQAATQVDPALRETANKTVQAGVNLLEQAVAAGHTKNMHSAAQALRRLLKAHGPLIDDALAARVHQALVSAGELSGWQRWSADQLREQLVARAEALLAPRRKRRERPARAAEPEGNGADATSTPDSTSAVERPSEVASAAPMPESLGDPVTASEAVSVEPLAAEADVGADGQAEPPAATQPEPDLVPIMGGRKLQEEIRKLRDEWKTADRGGAPNQALWHRFDRACNAAYVFVEAWQEKARAEAAQAKAERLALIAEVNAWSAAQQPGADADWRAVQRQVRGFADRWRNAGHIGEKIYAELQPQWKQAIGAAAAPLEAEQKASRDRRQAMIAEAQQLGAAPALHIDAIKALQQRWQEEARAVPLVRKYEERLWTAFRQPLDDAFKRRSAQRDQERAVLGAHDRSVLQASKALEAAVARGDAEQIRAAMAELDAVTSGRSAVPAAAPAPASGEPVAPASSDAPAEMPGEAPQDAETSGSTAGDDAAPASAAEPAPAPAPAKPVVAVRGDDRPDARRPAAGGRGNAAGRDHRDGGRPDQRRDRREGDRYDRRGPPRDRGPRLGQAAFNAQRDAASHAQAALRDLAAQAHGEALMRLLGAWQERNGDSVPDAKELGRAVAPALRNTWIDTIAAPAGDPAAAATALLRLELAAEVPTPADQLDARRALQLHLLTHRNDPGPTETWGQDVAEVLSSGYDERAAHRLRAALKVLLRQGGR